MIIKNKLIFMFFIILLFSTKISFGADVTDGFGFTLDWLNKTLVENDWNYNVDEISFGILALNSKNYDTKKGVDKEWGFYEWLHGITGVPDGGSNPYQGWSAGMYAFAYSCVKKRRVPYFKF